MSCKQNCVHYTTLYTTNTQRLRLWDSVHFKAIDVNWCVKVWDWGIQTLIVCPTLGRQHNHVAYIMADIHSASRQHPAPSGQTTSLTLTTGVCEACTKRRGCEQHEYSL